MELSKQEYQAVRVFHRAYRHIGEARDLAERADAGFDAGEWSGPHHAAAAEAEFNEVLAMVAGRLGMSADALHTICQIAEHDEVYRMQEAHLCGKCVAEHSGGRSIKRLRIENDRDGWSPEWAICYNGREMGVAGGGHRFSTRGEALDAALRAEEHFRQHGAFPNICEEY